MNTIKLLIADDEPFAHQILEGYCQKMDGIEVIGHTYDGISTLNFLNKNKVDALLLDIQMPDLTGFELLDSLKQNTPKVIFTTAFTEHALKGFEYDQVIDYLHKPIRITRFIKTIERLRGILKVEHSSSNLEQNSFNKPIQNSIIIQDNKTTFRLLYADILYIQSWGNYLKVFLKNKETKVIRKTVKAMDSELPNLLFQRIHKSYIVNINFVQAIKGNTIYLEEQTLPIGNSYLVNTKKILSK